MDRQNIIDLPFNKAGYLLNHICVDIDQKWINLPSPHHVEEVWVNSNRSNLVLRSFQSLLCHSRLDGTGYCSILPVDKGLEHSAGSAAQNPIYGRFS